MKFEKQEKGTYWIPLGEKNKTKQNRQQVKPEIPPNKKNPECWVNTISFLGLHCLIFPGI